MTALLWLKTDEDEAIDLGVDSLRLYQVFSEMDHAGGMAGYEELFGVIDASEAQDDVDPAWLGEVGAQATKFLKEYGGGLGEEAKLVLSRLTPGGIKPPEAGPSPSVPEVPPSPFIDGGEGSDQDKDSAVVSIMASLFTEAELKDALRGTQDE